MSTVKHRVATTSAADQQAILEALHDYEQCVVQLSFMLEHILHLAQRPVGVDNATVAIAADIGLAVAGRMMDRFSDLDGLARRVGGTA